MGAGASSTTLLPLSRPSDLLAAEVRRVDAEAATCDERLASADLLLRFLPVTVCGALAAGLALDFYLHESPTHIKRHMLRTLRSSRPPATLPPAPALMLPVPQRPLPLDFAVQLLLGPPGCGKSTLLGTIASTLPAPAPVVLVRMRLPATLPSESADVPP